MIWIAYGEYMSACATERTQGFYFGYFWCVYMAGQIIGNGIGGIVIRNVPGLLFFLLLGIAMILAAFAFFLLRKPIQVNQEPEEQDV